MRTTFYFALFLAIIVLAVGSAYGASSPKLYLPFNSVDYGTYFRINATPQPIYDTIRLYIDNNLVAGPTNGIINYSICSTYNNCLKPGLYTITVYDINSLTSTAENLRVTPVVPQLAVQKNSTVYGDIFKITVIPPADNDSVSILLNNSTLVNGNGYFIYTVCSFSIGDKCIAPGTYNVVAVDSTDNASSKSQKLQITPILPQLSIQNNNTQYGKIDTLTAIPAISEDTVYIYANSTILASGTGNVTYQICGSGGGTNCLIPGIYNIRVYDSSENVSTANQILNITSSALPKITLEYGKLDYGKADIITATAPYKNDSVEIRINGAIVASGSGTINYTICSLIANTACIRSGISNITSYDGSEQIFSLDTHLNITPIFPTFTVSSYQIAINNSDNLTASAPLYGDSIAIVISGANVVSGTGSVRYDICKNNSTSCLKEGTYNITACDWSEDACTPIQKLVVYGPASTTIAQIENSTPNKANNTTNTTQPTKPERKIFSIPINLLYFMTGIASFIVVMFIVLTMAKLIVKRNKNG